ncbi:probable ribonuclease ZC3H12C isoform X2 [Toxorhynchites rutilus septentrionalis]|uniref:probable ribonuclease ZC3H12C isoform X2 n=1 Tax=Toxorhynchites rutilus septentrionalis TaxID=329112 RepID=UPI0024788D84|nr:probable ribonuclease ZC3H12C isoform X2 [Toxorhynchites rutilus septentrionalis]
MLIATNYSQKQYLDSLCVTEAEDSSYDSDCEGDDLSHQQVSRTTSDTLGQEFAEYVSQSEQQLQQYQDRSPGYTQRVEFALKLGYTERLVQAALQRLGPNPAQNELLAELIKLGSQSGTKGTGEFTTDGGLGDPLLLAPTSEYGSPGLLLHQGTGSSSTLVGASASASEESLRPIVIDGSNVAMSHGNKEVFSCRGIRLCVDWFKNRGHRDITVFVPKWRKESTRPDNPVKDGEILNELEKERMLVFTPSRLVGGKRMVCYDDRYILKLAAENDGIVVSNDNYRDLVQESSEFKKVVEERVLMYSFVNDRFMPPDDPLGRSGPTLDNFLRVQPRKGDPPPPCPYGKKCTYGNKCKFYHPERGSMPHKSVTERLSEYAARHLQARSCASVGEAGSGPTGGRTVIQGKSLSVPLSNSSSETSPINDKRKALCRTRSNVPPESNSTTTSSNSNLFSMNPGDQLQQQLHQSQSHHAPQQHPYMTGPNRSNWDISPLPLPHTVVDSQIFPKSHSIENITKETYNQQLHHSNSYSASLWNRQQQQQQQQQQTQPIQPQQQVDPCDRSMDPSVNLHRKLQRQLTLNPAGCDPRIYQMQRNVSQHQSQHHSAVQLSPHRPLAPSLSGGARSNPAAAQWDLHENVTRIASAPDPSRPWHTGPPPASSSEPHINLWPPQQQVGNPSSATSGVIGPPSQAHQQLQDQRRRLHYHLASIFPEEQVQAVMQMYPDETNPQKICAAILAMFPKM